MVHFLYDISLLFPYHSTASRVNLATGLEPEHGKCEAIYSRMEVSLIDNHI